MNLAGYIIVLVFAGVNAGQIAFHPQNMWFTNGMRPIAGITGPVETPLSGLFEDGTITFISQNDRGEEILQRVPLPNPERVNMINKKNELLREVANILAKEGKDLSEMSKDYKPIAEQNQTQGQVTESPENGIPEAQPTNYSIQLTPAN